MLVTWQSKKDFLSKVAGNKVLDKLLNDAEKLAAMLDKKPLASRKSKRQSGQKVTATLEKE